MPRIDISIHREYNQKWYRKHSKEKKASNRAYRKANPELILWRKAKARAKKKKKPFSIKVEDIRIPDICPVFGFSLNKDASKPSFNSPSLDAIIPELGYVPGNIAVISYRANAKKSDSTPEELRKIADWIDSNAR